MKTLALALILTLSSTAAAQTFDPDIPWQYQPRWPVVESVTPGTCTTRVASAPLLSTPLRITTRVLSRITTQQPVRRLVSVRPLRRILGCRR